jgi:triosephosphate isomerase
MIHEQAKKKFKTCNNHGWTVTDVKKGSFEEDVENVSGDGKVADRKPLIAGNWKMNKTKAEAAEFVRAFREIGRDTAVDTALLVPFTDLDTVKEAIGDDDIAFGAENVYFEESGAFTGEVSLPMLKEIGVDYCIVGHSERRQYFAETDKTCGLKLKKLFDDSSITPILCVGEKLQVREKGREKEFVKEQLREGLLNLEADDVKGMVIAYEPIWAIGTGETATPEQAQEMCRVIRKKIYDMFGAECAREIRILYGGSVKPENAAQIMACDDIDGALVGGASLDPQSFADIVNYKKNAAAE